MKLYEFEGNDLFRQEGIPAPDYRLAASPREARQKAEELGVPVVIKAQVLSGGRGRAGGVQFAASPEQAEKAAEHILTSTVGGLPVHRVMVARKVSVTQEFYLSIVVDGHYGTPRVILSPSGGMSIEEVSRKHPERVISCYADITTGFSLSESRQMASQAGLEGEELVAIAHLLQTLYGVFRKHDAMLVEVNPLARTCAGKYLALDAKVEIDDSSLYRHPELDRSPEERMDNPLERKGNQIGVTYVDLDGEIGIIASGAGLGMATMDIISRSFRPANFLETGGAISADLLYQAMALVMQKKSLKGVFLNLYGGINPIHEGAKGIVRYLQEHSTTIPIVAKALGNRQEETWQILREGGVYVVTDVATERGIEELARLLRERR
jgi:succinyl-CoA synthetase beta subunit